MCYQLPEFAYATPPELQHGGRRTTGLAKLRYPLVIVGAGLAGLTLAADLASRGVRAVVLDDDNTVGVKGASSRGIAYVQRSLEVMERIGVGQSIAAKGVRWSVGQVLSGDTVVHRFDLQSDSVSQQPPFINIQQFYVEWYLVDRITELGCTELRWKSRVTDVENHADHVVLEVATPEGAYRLEADWVVDAEGVNSTVRQRLGLAARIEHGQDRWCITDVRFEHEQANERWTWIDANFNEGRAVWRHPMADDVWRLDFQMDPNADPEHVGRPDVARERVSAMVGPDEAFEIVWVGPYAYRTLLMERFRHGRLLFIGDAAHAKSPFGGRGGNSGIMDADNLGWKLALLLAGRAGSAILDTYAEERHRAAVENIRITARTTRFLRPPSPAEALLRAAVLRLSRDFPFARMLLNSGRLCTPHHYGGLPTVGPGPLDGRSIANVPLLLQGREGCLIDVLREAGAEPVAFLFGLGEPARDALLAAARAAGLPLSVRVVGADVDDAIGLLAAQTGAAEGNVALLRPDGHLAALLADASPSPLLAALRRTLGLAVAPAVSASSPPSPTAFSAAHDRPGEP